MKKLLSVFFCIVLIFSLGMGASAATPNTDVSPLVYTPCSSGNGICQMKSSGWANLIDVDTNDYIMRSAPCWKCKNCGTYMVTQGEPILGEAIGKYATSTNVVAIDYIKLVYVKSSAVRYSSSSSLEGYKFTYN